MREGADIFSHALSPKPPTRSSREFHETGRSCNENRQFYFELGCIQGPYFSVSPLVFPSLSSAFVLGALLPSPSLSVVRPPATCIVRPVLYGPRAATQYGVIAPFPLVTTSSRRGMEATALRSVFW